MEVGFTYGNYACESGRPRPRARVFGPAYGIDGFWVRLRAEQLSTAANPTKGPPVAPCIIISSQPAVVRDSQHSRAIVHVHRFHRVCQRLILILVDQHGAFRVVHLNDCAATARHGCGRGEVHDDLRPTLEDMDDQIVPRRMTVKRRQEIATPASREVRDAYQSQFVHKAGPPEIPVEKGVERAVESHAGRSIHPPRDREVGGNEKFR